MGFVVEDTDTEKVYRALLVRDGGCSYQEKWDNAMYVDQYLLGDTDDTYTNNVGSVIDGLVVQNSIRYLILYDSDAGASDHIALSVAVNTKEDEEEGEETIHDGSNLNGTFVWVSPRMGNNLFLLLRNRYLYSNNGNGDGDGPSDPNVRGLYIQLDTRRIDGSWRTPGFFDTYGLILVFFLVLFVASVLKRRWLMRRTDPTHTPPNHERNHPQTSTNTHTHTHRTRTRTRSRTIPTVVPKEQLSALPLIPYHTHHPHAHPHSHWSVEVEVTDEKDELTTTTNDGNNSTDREVESVKEQPFHETSDDEHKEVKGLVGASAGGGGGVRYYFQNSVCHICLDDFEEGEWVRKLPCQHLFHPPCIDVWLTERQDYCPVCKAPSMGSTTNRNHK